VPPKHVPKLMYTVFITWISINPAMLHQHCLAWHLCVLPVLLQCYYFINSRVIRHPTHLYYNSAVYTRYVVLHGVRSMYPCYTLTFFTFLFLSGFRMYSHTGHMFSYVSFLWIFPDIQAGEDC